MKWETNKSGSFRKRFLIGLLSGTMVLNAAPFTTFAAESQAGGEKAAAAELQPAAEGTDSDSSADAKKEITYKIKFDANGGTINYINEKDYTATTADTSWTSNTLPGGANLTKLKGKTFIGWATEKDAAEPKYHYNDTVTLTKDNPTIILYAVYQDARTVAFFAFDPDNK